MNSRREDAKRHSTGAINQNNSINSTNSKYFLITIDVEDWFQVENFKPWIPFSTWDSRELRVERNVHRLLDLFDTINLPPLSSNSTNPIYPVKFSIETSEADFTGTNPTNPSPRRVRCTFFILGWLAERLPHLVREIHARGHEIAYHGYNHELPNKMSPDNLKQDLEHGKKMLEDIIGNSVNGYRAPSFAINETVLDMIKETGYLYDSSYNSFSLHGRYGKITLNGQPKAGIAHAMTDRFYEIPISNMYLNFATNNKQKIKNVTLNQSFVVPVGGGAYFRLQPFRFFRYGVRKILERQDAYLFYAHPWEFDPGQPRVEEASWFSSFKHYSNLEANAAKLARMIKAFSGCDFVTCREYLGCV